MSQHQDEGIIDVERRKTTSEYTLGDPTLFPPEFLSWLKRFIEQSGIELPASSIFGTLVPNVGSFRGLPAGMVSAYAGTTTPPGALICNGASYERAAYPKLFEVIGVTYGAVDATHFSVPDLQGRVLVAPGTHVSVNAVGKNEGVALPNRSPLHRHTVTDPGHSHGGGSVGGVQGPPNGNLIVQDGSHNAAEVVGIGSSGTGITVTPGGTTPPNHTPAYFVLTYVITTG